MFKKMNYVIDNTREYAAFVLLVNSVLDIILFIYDFAGSL